MCYSSGLKYSFIVVRLGDQQLAEYRVSSIQDISRSAMSGTAQMANYKIVDLRINDLVD
jgi:hypothetical protein